MQNTVHITYTFIFGFIMIRTEKRLNEDKNSRTADVKCAGRE